MKKLLLQTLALVFLLGAAGIGTAQAQSSVYVRIGSQPPPPIRYERPWAPPYKTSVWVPGHNEWRNGRYIWVSGYYAYPPRRNARWVAAQYQHAPNGYYYYRAGHWVY